MLDVMALSDEARWDYQHFVEEQRLQRARLETARDEGKLEGKEEELRVFAQRLIARGMSAAEVAELTGLTIDEVESLRRE